MTDYEHIYDDNGDILIPKGPTPREADVLLATQSAELATAFAAMIKERFPDIDGWVVLRAAQAFYANNIALAFVGARVAEDGGTRLEFFDKNVSMLKQEFDAILPLLQKAFNEINEKEEKDGEEGQDTDQAAQEDDGGVEAR